MSTDNINPARQSATLYSWNTSPDDIKVTLNGAHLEVSIGDLRVVLSAKTGENTLDLAKKFGEVTVTETITQRVRV